MRIDIIRILNDKELRKDLFVQTIIAIQAREGIETTKKQAEEAYDKIQIELRRK